MFVRDRGPGFDLDAVPEDRLGLRQSVIGRMDRHGGAAVVRTVAGDGTEVQLEMPRRDQERAMTDQPPSERPTGRRSGWCWSTTTGCSARGARRARVDAVEVVGEAEDVAAAVAVITATAARRRAARRAPARRRRARGAAGAGAAAARRALPRAVGLRRAGGRDRA